MTFVNKNYTIWILGSFFYCYQYIVRVIPSVMMSDLIPFFNDDKALYGQFSGIYYIGYSIVHIPVGILLDRVNTKKILTICVLLTALGLLPLLFISSSYTPIIGRLITGIGSSGAILGLFKIIRHSFPDNEFNSKLGISVTIGLLGAIYGGEPVSYLILDYGFKLILLSLILAGFILAAFIYYFTPNYDNEINNHSIFNDIKQVLTSKKIIAICIFSGLMIGPLEGFADVWGADFFKNIYNLSNNTSNRLPSIIFLGMCFGTPIIGYIVDKTKTYIRIIIACGAVMVIGLLLIIFLKLNTYLISIILFIIGIVSAYQIPAIYKTTTYVPKNLIGIATSVANMIIMSFGYFIHTLVGATYENSIKLGFSNVTSFSNALCVIPILILIAMLGFLKLRKH